MSKPTLQERAAAYCEARTPYAAGGSLATEVAGHLAQFAAREVAMVREAVLEGLVDTGTCAVCERNQEAIDAATRPEKPPRAKAAKKGTRKP